MLKTYADGSNTDGLYCTLQLAHICMVSEI